MNRQGTQGIEINLLEIKEYMKRKRRITESEYDMYRKEVITIIYDLGALSSPFFSNNSDAKAHEIFDKFKKQAFALLDKIHFKLRGYSLGIK